MFSRHLISQTATRLAVASLLSSFILGSSTALADCPTAEWVCSTYGPILGFDLTATGNGCVGPDCFDKVYGEESTVVAADDYLFADKWKMRQAGILTNISCALLQDSANTKTTIWIPEERHCAVTQQTDYHFYVHFFASNPNPDSLCLGWAECKFY